ncbi:hypothetical protein KA047_03375 [Candidatus Saccharibacteria bacterium]|nr:hypothetical protein [Candidatus Saccharibacteria bacterium]
MPKTTKTSKVTAKKSAKTNKKVSAKGVVGGAPANSRLQNIVIGLLVLLAFVALGTFAYGKYRASNLKAQAAGWTTIGQIGAQRYGSYGSLDTSKAAYFFACREKPAGEVTTQQLKKTTLKLIIDNKSTSRHFWYTKLQKGKVVSTSGIANAWWGGNVYAARLTIDASKDENVRLYLGGANYRNGKQPAGYYAYDASVGLRLKEIMYC